MINKPNFYIITGGPGVGKTTLLEELNQRGYEYVPEIARDIIARQMVTAGDALPWMNKRKYADMMLSHSVDDFLRMSDRETLLFFDRGIPDTFGYKVLIKQEINPELLHAVNTYRYNPTVFILPPWREIYETDSERKQDYNEAVETYDVMKKVYSQLGYKLIDVPPAPVGERANFVLQLLDLL